MEIDAQCKKMEIAWETTPAELRSIAHMLEQEGCNQVRVNWYHTQLCFVLPKKEKKNPWNPVIEVQGNLDGTIPSKEYRIEDKGKINE